MSRTQFRTLGVATGLTVLTFLIQHVNGAYSSELTTHPDEPAHFVTSLMIHDYVKTGLGSSPLRFAEDYYTHSPKVAFGHWPPFAFMPRAGWFLITGPSKAAAYAFEGILAAAIAILLFLSVRRFFGDWFGFLSGVAFLLLPLIQGYSQAAMAEFLVALLQFGALLAFAGFLDSGGKKPLVVFVICSSLAILTKAGAVALAGLPILAILFSGRLRLFKSPSLWIAGASVVALTAPVYLLIFDMTRHNSGGGLALSTGILTHNLTHTFLGLLATTGTGIAVLAILGLSGLGRADVPAERHQVRNLLACCAALVVSIFVFYVFTPLFVEARYLIGAIPGILILAVHTLHSLPLRERPRALRLGVPAAIGVLAYFVSPGVPQQPLPPKAHGYAEAADAVPSSAKGRVVLVSSSSVGEGAVVAELRLCDGDDTFTLRASKVLARDGWNGGAYELLVRNEQEILQLLETAPVHYVIMDRTGAASLPNEHRKLAPSAHHDLLESTIRSHAERFRLVREVEVVTRVGNHGQIRIYEYLPTRGRPPVPDELTRLQRPTHRFGGKRADRRTG